MLEIDIIIGKLDGVRKSGDGFVARCPAHDDQHQSLSVRRGEGDRVLLYCHAGCDFKNIIAALGITRETKVRSSEIVATYDYTDAAGNLLYQVVRFFPKDFRQRMANGEWGLGGMKPTLYKLPRVLEGIKHDETIFIVEGEKDVEVLSSEGLFASSVSGGSSSVWSPEVIGFLCDARVAFIPDNDNAGIEYARRVASLLHGWCKSLKVLSPLGREQGYDVSDYLSDHDIQSILNMVDNAKEFFPVGAITRDEFYSLKRQLHFLHGKFSKRKGSYD